MFFSVSSLTNVKRLTNNFRQSVQIYCREKEKEGNDGNRKAFCITCKCKNPYEICSVVYKCKIQNTDY